MLLHNSVHCVGYSSFYHCIIQWEAKQKDQCRGFLQFPVGIISDFQLPSWFQADSSAAVSDWGCAVNNLGSSLPIFFLNLTNFKSSLLASSTTSQTEVSYRAQFMNPEVGMLFCSFIKQTLLINSVQHGDAGFWLMAWNWQNHFEICRFYCTTFLDSCLYPSNM